MLQLLTGHLRLAPLPVSGVTSLASGSALTSAPVSSVLSAGVVTSAVLLRVSGRGRLASLSVLRDVLPRRFSALTSSSRFSSGVSSVFISV